MNYFVTLQLMDIKRRIVELRQSEKFGQFVRFALNGCLSSAVHYAIYYLLLFVTTANAAYITGYLVSFVGNYLLTNYFTFRTRPSWRHFIGFCGSHAVNFGLHVVLFNLLLALGVHRLLVPLFVMGFSVIVQFSILRFVFVKKNS